MLFRSLSLVRAFSSLISFSHPCNISIGIAFACSSLTFFWLPLSNISLIRFRSIRELSFTLLSIVLSFSSLSSFIPLISSTSLSIPFCRLLMFQRVSSALSLVQLAVFRLSSSSASATLICPKMRPFLFFHLKFALLGCQW